MARGTSLEQAGGENSENYQSGGDQTINVYNSGMSAKETLDLIEDAIRRNSFVYRSVAEDVFNNRIQEFTGKWYGRVRDEKDEILAATSDPDVQHTIIQAGVSYGRSGDENMADLLVDLLVDRAQAQGRSLLAVVINDAVAITPRLTDGEVAILTVAWRMLMTRSTRVNSLETLAEYVRELALFIPEVPRGGANYLHLQALGCGNTISFAQTDFAEVWLRAYGGLFSNGFTEDSIPAELLHLRGDGDMFIPCLRDPSKLQVKVQGIDVLDDILPGTPWEPYRAQLEDLMKLGQMSADEVVDTLADIAPEMGELSDIWQNTMLKSFNLTAVGIAIAHANFRLLTNDGSPLSTWIDES